MRAVLFCHTDGQKTEEMIEKELDRQYKRLSRYASAHGFQPEQLFFHIGELDYAHPDAILLRFLHGLQNGWVEIVIAETRDFFPNSQMRFIPPVQACFLKERIRQMKIGSRQCPLPVEKDTFFGKTYLYGRSGGKLLQSDRS